MRRTRKSQQKTIEQPTLAETPPVPGGPINLTPRDAAREGLRQIAEAASSLPPEKRREFAFSLMSAARTSYTPKSQEPIPRAEYNVKQLPTATLRRSLEKCQARIQALLAAFPSLIRVRHSMDAPQEEQEYATLREEDRRLRLELIRRGENPASQADGAAQSPAPASTANPTDPHTQHIDPEVAKREAIVRNNRGTPNQGLCTLLDDEKVPVPKGWVTGKWAQAYKSPQYKSQVQVILAKAKRRAD